MDFLEGVLEKVKEEKTKTPLTKLIWVESIDEEKVRLHAERKGWTHVRRTQVPFAYHHRLRLYSYEEMQEKKRAGWDVSPIRVLGEYEDVYKKGAMVMSCSASFQPMFDDISHV
jgi:hypothetical protein